MAAHAGNLRRGLPRRRGGDAWPPLGEAPGELDATSAETPAAAAAPIASAPVASAPVAPAVVVAVASASGRRLRTGLPRVAGGRPWPEAGAAAIAENVGVTDAAAFPQAAVIAEPTAALAVPMPVAPRPAGAAASSQATGGGLRRGLPRVTGGDPWPVPSAVAPVAASVPAAAEPLPAPVAPVAAEPLAEAVVTDSAAPPPAASVEAESPLRPPSRSRRLQRRAPHRGRPRSGTAR